MCSNQAPNLMMQPQEYCSCDVCGNRKHSSKSDKKCTFDQPSTRVSKSSCTSVTEDSEKETDCTVASLQLNSESSRQSSKNCSSKPCKDKRSSAAEPNIALCPPDEPFDCENTFTPSGMCPPKTAGPLGKRFDCCSKYAPCGHWNTCSEDGHQHDKLFEGCDTTETRAPYGPYGPWNKFGPSKFKIPLEDVILKQFPTRSHNGLNSGKKVPMGKMRPWPLSGSCRYAGRPYGPCRPYGAYRARGPFGIWEVGKCDVESVRRPSTPCQPCWKPRKPGRRPCTPCHRPLFVACKTPHVQEGKCDFKSFQPGLCLPVCEN